MRSPCYFVFFVSCLSANPSGHLPLRFEPADGGGYVARAGSHAYFVTRSGALRLSPQLEMRLRHANRSPRASALDLLPGKTNDLRGDQPARWRTGVPQYGRLEFRSVYPGIDLVYHATQSELEYDFIVAPGASPDRIVLDFAGADNVRLTAGGDLVVGDARLRRPRIAQGRESVAGGYRLLGSHRVAFRIGPYDRARPLIIDPVLGYAALFGDRGGDPIQALAVDSAGNIYIAGTTASEIPLLNPINPTLGGGNCSPEPYRTFQPCENVFVAKLDPTGTQLLYSTYLGGNQRDSAAAIAVDRDGNCYVAGTTRPAGFLLSQDGQAFGSS